MVTTNPYAAGRILQPTAAALLLAVVLCATVSQASVVPPKDNLVNGPCRLRSGRRGECRLITECPSALAAVRSTARQGHPSTRHERCGFKGNIEIVCCERNADTSVPGHQTPGGVQHNLGSRDPSIGHRRPWVQGGGRPHHDSQWLPGANQGGGPSGTPTKSQNVEGMAAAACRVYSTQCPNNVSPYITNGTVAGLGEIPHMAALGYSISIMGESIIKWDCGGTLISDRYVMTAAHCTNKVDGAPVVVRLGDQDLIRDDDGAQPVDFTVEKITMHPSYSSGSSYHDIALLRLGRSVNFTQFICPACLYLGGDSDVSRRSSFDVANRMAQEGGEDVNGTSFHEDAYETASDYELSNRMLWSGEEVGPRLNDEDDLRDKSLFVSGWGVTNFSTGDRSSVLLLAYIVPFDSNECNTSLHESTGRPISLIPRGVSPKAQICAGDRNGARDSCLGDSGGPLQFKGKTSSSLQTVVGVTSFGLKCGFGLPGVYTRVSSYLNWIEQIVWPHGPPS